MENKEGLRLGRLLKLFFLFLVGMTVMIAVVAALVFLHFSHDLPKIITVADYRPLGVTRVVTGTGEVIGEFYKERRYLVPYDKIPEIVIGAFVSAEDEKFFEHGGFNIPSIIRASIANFRAGRVVQGGSTITQQVAKSLLLTPHDRSRAERSFGRKIREVILASRIEKNLTKQQILYLYLNQIYLGHGAYGVQAAALTYFRKDISQLTLPEAALLGGLPQAPGIYSPLLNPHKAKERQLYVLKRMYENRKLTKISEAQMTEAAAQKLRIYHDEDLNNKYSAYLIEYLRKYLVEKYGEKSVYEEGLTIQVPASPALSLAARKSLRAGLEAVDRRQGYRGALQHLKTQEEVAKFLKDEREELVSRKVQFQLLLPEGKLDLEEGLTLLGLTPETKILEAGENYPAVVMGSEPRRKSLVVMIGSLRAEIPRDRLSWVKSEKAPVSGDVVLVRVLAVAPNIDNSERAISLELTEEPQVQGALFSIDAQTGFVLAMEGGYDFGESEFNRATQAQRQPGSAFKPIIYAAGLEKGYTPVSILMDSPIVYEDAESGKWKPANFEEKFYGETTYRQALIKSRNVPTIKIVQSIQVPYLIDFAKRLGMTAQFPPDLSISLGSMGVSLLEMTRIYALFPRMGRRVEPVFLMSVSDRDGRVLEEHHAERTPSLASIKIPPLEKPDPSSSPSPSAPMGANQSALPKQKVIIPTYPLPDDPDQILDPRVAYVMTHLMKEVVSYGTGYEAKSLGRPAAGKTGTTNEFGDAWFMGFTPQVVTGVWVGFDNHKPIGSLETGARAALPIWLSYMKEATKSYPEEDFAVPPDVVFASIDPVSGKLAPPNASNAIKEAFIAGTEPTEVAGKRSVKPQSQSDFFKEDTE